jgi:hypothetical protein
MSLHKREVLGGILLIFGLVLIVGLVDSNPVRILTGLFLVAMGVVILLAQNDREAVRNTQELFKRNRR